MNKSYDLIDGLFSPASSSLSAKSSTVVRTVEEKHFTKRTWRILDEQWDDFVTLCAIRGITQADQINAMIKDDVEQNTELLKNYRKMTQKK